MRAFLRSLSFFSLAVILGPFQQGCTIQFQVVKDPAPNLHRIERLIQMQRDQIDSAVQTNQLDRPVAQALADNVDMVHGLTLQYQESAAQSEDLTDAQTLFLNNLLTDNEMAINDAIQRRDQWAQVFQGGWEFGSGNRQDGLLYTAFLNYKLEQQQADIEDAVQSGRLSVAQSEQLKSRIGIIRGTALNDYGRNGRLVLNLGQIHQLNQMAEDNRRLLRFRTQWRHGNWHNDKYRSWNAPGTPYRDNSWVKSASDPDQSRQGAHRYWDGRPVRPDDHPLDEAGQQAPNSQRAVWTPTSTPVPERPRLNANRNDAGRPSPAKGPGQGRAVQQAPNAQPAVAVPTSTPVPAAVVPPSATRVLGRPRWNGGGNFNVGSPHPKGPAQGGPTASKATEKYLPADPLKARLQKQDESLRKAVEEMGRKGDRTLFGALHQKNNAIRKAFNDYQSQNRQKGFTQEQSDQLTKMMDDFDKTLAGPAPPNPVSTQ